MVSNLESLLDIRMDLVYHRRRDQTDQEKRKKKEEGHRNHLDHRHHHHHHRRMNQRVNVDLLLPIIQVVASCENHPLPLLFGIKRSSL